MTVEHIEGRPRSADGTQLYSQRWSPSEGEPIAEILVLHGLLEHGGRYRELAHFLAERRIATTALDYRGHGRAAGKRGHVNRFEDYHDDAAAGLATLPGGKPRFVLGHSHGALIALDWLTTRAPDVRGLVVTNPFLVVAMEVPAIKLWASKVAAQVYPRLSFPTAPSPHDLSRQPGVADAYKRDPLVFSTVSAGWHAQWLIASRRARELRQVGVPLLYVFSDSDPIASPAPNRQLAEQLGDEDKTVILRRNELHEVLNEVDRVSLYGTIASWIAARAH